MTTPTSAHRIRDRQFTVALTFRDDFVSQLRALVERLDTVAFPVGSGHRWYRDPVAFVREALGDEPFRHQVEFMIAVRDHEKAAFASDKRSARRARSFGSLCGGTARDPTRASS